MLAGYGTDVDVEVIRGWWSLRCLTAIQWLVEHGFDPSLPGCEIDVLRSQVAGAGRATRLKRRVHETEPMSDESVEPLTTEQLIAADRRDPNVAEFAGGVSSDEQHAALRASVRQLGTLLGEALTRHEGPELLDLVEQVRALTREPDDGALAELLAGVDARTAIVLARAFTAYFQLVNVTEQLHRWQELTNRPERPLAATTRPDRRGARGGQHRPRRWSRTCWRGWSTARSSPPTRPRPAAARCSGCCAGSPR